MKVKYNNTIFVIETILQLNDFIITNGIIKDFKSYPSNKVGYVIKMINDTSDINIKQFRRIFKLGMFPVSSKFKIEYWTQKGWTVNDAKYKISNIQRANANKLVEKRKTNPDLYNGRYSNQLEYWIKQGYDEHTARIKLKERQSTFSRKSCIDKHGEIRGIEIFNQRQRKWQQTMVSKTPDEIADINRRKMVNFTNASKQSIRVFTKTLNLLDEHGIEYYVGCGDSKEYFLNDNGVVYFYDLTIPELHLIIEFNGVKWHPRENDLDWTPLFENSDDRQSVLLHDKKKIEVALKNGFDIRILWSDVDEFDNSNTCYGYVESKIIEN